MMAATLTLVILSFVVAAIAIAFAIARTRRSAPEPTLPAAPPTIEAPRDPPVDPAVANILAKATTQPGDRRTHEEMIDDALRIVISLGGVSVPALQRKLKIDFTRATELVALLEARGFVSAPSAGHKRKILPAAIEHIDALDAAG